MYFHQRHILSGCFSYDISSHQGSLPRLGLADFLYEGQTVNLLVCGPCGLYHSFSKLPPWRSSSHGQCVHERAWVSSNKTIHRNRRPDIAQRPWFADPVWIVCFMRGLQDVETLILSFLLHLLVGVPYKERFSLHSLSPSVLFDPSLMRLPFVPTPPKLF